MLIRGVKEIIAPLNDLYLFFGKDLPKVSTFFIDLRLRRKQTTPPTGKTSQGFCWMNALLGSKALSLALAFQRLSS